MFTLFIWIITENATTDIQTSQPTDGWTLSTMAVHIFLPLAGLVFLWNRKDIFTKLWLQLDRNCVSVFCPSFSQREKLLKWAGSRLPSTWSSQTRTLSGGVGELFLDGSLLCTLINSAVPGACPNPHRHWKKPPTHAQAIAYKYLGVIPVFTESDLAGELSTSFINYLNEVQLAIEKLQESKNYSNVFSCDFIARGMGLYTGEQYRKAEFYIYPNPHSKKNCESSVIVQIRGPYGTFGKATIPQFYKKLSPQKNNPRKVFLNRFSLKKIIKYHETTIGDNMTIDIKMEEDRARINYIPKNYGIYEINLIANGELLKGCPFNVNIFSNTSGIEDTLEDEQSEEESVTYKKRKIISKTIDFIDKQMPMEDLKKLKKNLRHSSEHESSFKEVLDEVTKNALIVNEQEKLSIRNAQEELMKNQNLEKKNLINENPKKILMREEKIMEESEEDEEIVPNLINKLPNVVGTFAEENSSDPSETLLDSLDYNRKSKQEIGGVNNNSTPQKIGDYSTNSVTSDKHDEQISDDYANDINKQDINKIVIPDIFAGNDEHKNVLKPKSALFTSKQVEKLTNQLIVEDLNNNSVQPQITLIPPRFFQFPERHNGDLVPENAPEAPSPICRHIVPEGDDFRTLPLAEKRKVFCRKSPAVSEAVSQNSSFSSENADGSLSSGSKWEKLENMKILYVLGSLKQSDQETSFTSTVSLPNFPSFDADEVPKTKVKQKKDFWEKLSSRSSSSSSTVHTDGISSPKNKINKATEYEKLVWSKPNKKHVKNQSKDVRKSADDILSMTECLGYSSKKYRSMDNSLDTCTMLSIEDRKKLLLKNEYEKEKIVINKLRNSKSIGSLDKDVKKEEHATEKKVEREEKSKTSAVLEKIRQFDRGMTKTTEIKTEPKTIKLKEAKPLNAILSYLRKASDPDTLKVQSHFKRAIKYFRNLENKSNGAKSKSRENFETARRRFSLEFPKIKRKHDRKWGSLNLPRISERFRINNLYNDVFGGRRGSFRGTPNKTAVIEALKTFSKSNKNAYEEDENEDEIKFSFFKNSRKKQRKSIRSIFDVTY